MRHRLILARSVAVFAALAFVSPLASAAAGKRSKAKPKHPAKETAPPAATAEGTPTPPPPEESAAPNPEASAAKPEPTPSPAPDPASTATAADAASLSGKTDAAIASGSAPAGEGNDSSNAEQLALGKREAARIAARRTEVGVDVGIDVGNRRFEYSDPIGGALRPYHLAIAPMVSFGLEAYPLATLDVPVLRDLGFRGRVSRAFGLDSTTPEGDKIDTSWTRFGGEVRERLLFSGRHPLELGAFFGADASYFVMSSHADVKALLPSARTVSLRFGLDGRVLVAGRFSTELGFAYLAVTSPGEIYDHFRDPHVAGIDGNLGFVLALVPGLEARLSGRYTRYFATFQPKVGDPYVAGGALDQQLQIGLGVRYAH